MVIIMGADTATNTQPTASPARGNHVKQHFKILNHGHRNNY